MTYAEVMAELWALGSPQNVKIYRRHGMGENVFGVSFANLARLQKRIKRDHVLALELWASGNADARHLALQIADPALAGRPLLEAWANDLHYYELCDLLAGFVVKTALAQSLAEEWIAAPGEWCSRTGWDVIGLLALRDATLSDTYFTGLLDRIERDIHGSPNFTRHAMNNALISIGMRNAELKGRAQAAARRIGKVLVDHGETGCRTPDAVDYIERAHARKSRKSTPAA